MCRLPATRYSLRAQPGTSRAPQTAKEPTVQSSYNNVSNPERWLSVVAGAAIAAEDLHAFKQLVETGG